MNEVGIEETNAIEISDQITEYYGLEKDPFSADNDVVFLTPQLSKLLKLLNYLSSFSDKVIVVTGESGVGKTTISGHFYDQLPQEREACWISALADDTLAQVLREIAEQTGIDGSDETDTEVLRRQISAHAKSLSKEVGSLVVIIDEAHVLNPQVLEPLLRLARDQDEPVPAIHLLLVGEPELESKVAQLIPSNERDREVFTSAVLPFNLKETNQYVQACFANAGEQTRVPFKEADYLRIYQESRGVPAQINTQARKVLAEGVNRLLDKPNWPKGVVIGAAVAGVLAAVLISIYWWQHSNQEPEAAMMTESNSGAVQRIERQSSAAAAQAGAATADASATSPDDDLNASAAEQETDRTDTAQDSTPAVAEPSQVQSQEDNTLAQTEDPPITEQQTTEPQTEASSTQAPVEETPPDASDREAVAAVAETETETENTRPLNNESARTEPGEAQQEAAADEAAPPERTSDSQVANTSAPYTADEAAVLAIAPDRYIMQVLGARTEDQILRFLESLSGRQGFHYYLTELNGQPWYVLVYGDYASYQEATNSLAELPEAVRKLKPWIRKVNAVQQAIKANAP